MIPSVERIKRAVIILREIMATRKRYFKRLLFFLIPILAGVGIFLVLVKTKPEPPKKKAVENRRVVRIIEVEAMDVVPKTRGFGTVRPTTEWQAIAEVSGKIKYINPSLKQGQLVSKDTLLVEFDPIEYKLSVAQAEANIRSIKTNIKQLQDKEKNNKELLNLELNVLEIKQKELDRQKKLLKDNISSRSVYEQAETGLIAQKYKVQALRNTLSSFTNEFELLQSQELQANLKLDSAKLQLENTRIFAPFDGIISSVKIEKSQFVQRGQLIAEADSIDSVEIEAQLSNGLHVFRPRGEQLPRENIFRESLSLEETLGITATVKPVSGKFRQSWQGKVMRFNASIDTKTRTPGVIIQVNDPFSLESKERKRPLIKGMYCEVELTGKAFENQLVIPSNAIHEGNLVYVLNSENKLMIKQVDVGFSQKNVTIILSGLTEGERVIITDIVPAVEGMTVYPILDEKMKQQLNLEARGE